MTSVHILWLTSVLCLITFCVHTFIGGPVVAKPLLESKELSKASKWLNYYCWHNTTVLLFLLSVAYGYSAHTQSAIELVVFATFLAGCLSILSGVIAIKGKINPFRFPSTSLFAGICVLGSISLAS